LGVLVEEAIDNKHNPNAGRKLYRREGSCGQCTTAAGEEEGECRGVAEEGKSSDIT